MWFQTEETNKEPGDSVVHNCLAPTVREAQYRVGRVGSHTPKAEEISACGRDPSRVPLNDLVRKSSERRNALPTAQGTYQLDEAVIRQMRQCGRGRGRSADVLVHHCYMRSGSPLQ